MLMSSKELKRYHYAGHDEVTVELEIKTTWTIDNVRYSDVLENALEEIGEDHAIITNKYLDSTDFNDRQYWHVTYTREF